MKKLLLIPALLLILAACGEEGETVETGYGIPELRLSAAELELGGTLVVEFTVTHPALDAKTGEYNVVEQIEIYLADDKDSIAFADGAISTLTGKGEAADFSNEILMDPVTFLPGAYEVHVTCFDKVNANERAEATARFTITGQPAEPLPENVQKPLPQEKDRIQ
ncbi:MAG: hypothetical protein NTW26_01810 [bacterium]|nr:hypothetical protein [bacterium]